MFWNDPKLYSANIPTNYFLPNREIFNYNVPGPYNFPNTVHPWQQFSHFTPYENAFPTHFGFPKFDAPKFDVPMNYSPFMTYGYLGGQLPFYRPFGW